MSQYYKDAHKVLSISDYVSSLHYICYLLGFSCDVFRPGGGCVEHFEGTHPSHVDEEVLPITQTVRKLCQ